MPLAYQQFQDFSRGISNDRFLGQWYARDVDWCSIRQSSKWVVLSNNYRTAPTFWTLSGSDYIYAFLVDVNPWGGGAIRPLAICGSKAVDTTTGTTFLSSVDTFRNALFVESAWTNYWAIIANWAIWRWDNDSSWIGTATSYLPLTWTSDFRTVLLDWAFLYIGGDWVVDCIDVSTSTWAIYKTLTMSGVCRWLSKQGDQIFVYTNDWLNWYRLLLANFVIKQNCISLFCFFVI